MINYYLLMKPGIILGNLFTFAAGFVLASNGSFSFWLFFYTLLGLAAIMASACVLNNYIDKPLDEKMERTKNRALVKGTISSQNALIFAFLLALFGNVLLYYFSNLTSVIVANIGFFVYVVLYSLWKAKTVFGTAIGSIAGAVPPVVGYAAVKNEIDLGALLLFALITLWQMPHFFAIALYRIEDYASAKIPVLPLEKGVLRTKVHMTLYIVGFMAIAASFSYFQYTGNFYLLGVLTAAFCWLYLCVKGFFEKDSEAFGKKMFQVSLIVIAIFCGALPFDLKTGSELIVNPSQQIASNETVKKAVNQP